VPPSTRPVPAGSRSGEKLTGVYPNQPIEINQKNMKQIIASISIAFSCAPPLATAQHIPLTCGDYSLLSETAIQHRDTKIPKEKSKYYLHDDSLSRKENSKVRAMIDRVYASPSKNKSYFVAEAYKECKKFK
jgi:hypothetical protein